MLQKSRKPRSYDEVGYFVDLMQNYSVITSKENNAATNKLKEDVWVSLTTSYNDKCGSFPKQKDQFERDNLNLYNKKAEKMV